MRLLHSSCLAIPLALLCCASTSLPAQSPATPNPHRPGPGNTAWEPIKNTVAEDVLRIDTWVHGTTCSFVSADDNSLTCTKQHKIVFFRFPERVTFRRSDIRRIRVSHQYRSGFVAGAIGAGAGATLGAVLDARENSGTLLGHFLTFFFAILFANTGAQIGYAVDFMAAPVIYQAP